MKAQTAIQVFVSFIVLSVGAWAFYDFYQSKKRKEVEEKQSIFLPDIKLEDLKAFRFFKKSKKELSVVKKDEEWFLTYPVKDLASLTEISSWFDSISQQKVQKLNPDQIDDKTYYLDLAPRVELDISLKQKSTPFTISFVVSKSSSFDGRYFIKKEGQLFLGEHSFSQFVNNKKPDSFRSKKILPSLNHVSKIEFKGKSNFSLNWGNYKWSLEKAKPKELPLSQDFLDDFWSDLTNLSADSILDSPKKLDKVWLTLNLFYANKKYILKISPFKKDKAYAIISHRDYVFELSKDSVDKIALSKKDIYNHSFPFEFDKERAFEIEVQNKEKSFYIKKKDQDWLSLSKADNKKFDSNKVSDMLDLIKGLKGERYKKYTDNKKPLRLMQIKDSTNQLIFELKELRRWGNLSWVKSNLWEEEIAVLKESLDEIFNKDLSQKEKTEKKEQT